MNNLKAAIVAMEKRGAPILGMTLANEKGELVEYDIQMNTWVARLPHAFRRSNTLSGDGLFFLAVDRNKARGLRKFNKKLTTEEAARNSTRLFPVKNIRSLRYMGVEIATS